MTLQEVFDRAAADGYTHAADMYSWRGRPLANWRKEVASDSNEYEYVAGNLGAEAKQVSRYPSNAWRFFTHAR